MKPLKVLFVDDEVELVQTLVERLELRGIDAEGVTTGKQALKRIEEQSYDVVLLDVKMPGIGGLEAMRTIRHLRPELKVILLTGHGSAQDAEEGTQLGAYDYIMKPIKIDKLIKLLEKAAECGKTPPAEDGAPR